MSCRIGYTYDGFEFDYFGLVSLLVYIVLQATANSRELEVKQLENEMKLKMLDSLDRFPKAVKVSGRHMDAG
jgi:hypothetical protein